MRRKTAILLCSIMLGLGAAGCMAIPYAFGENRSVQEEQTEPVKVMAWWSLMYEKPNPEKFPVKVRFQWLKGLE